MTILNYANASYKRRHAEHSAARRREFGVESGWLTGRLGESALVGVATVAEGAANRCVEEGLWACASERRLAEEQKKARCLTETEKPKHSAAIACE